MKLVVTRELVDRLFLVGCTAIRHSINVAQDRKQAGQAEGECGSSWLLTTVSHAREGSDIARRASRVRRVVFTSLLIASLPYLRLLAM